MPGGVTFRGVLSQRVKSGSFLSRWDYVQIGFCSRGSCSVALEDTSFTEVPFPINISTVSDRLNLIVFKHNCFFSAILFILHIISIFNKHHE